MDIKINPNDLPDKMSFKDQIEFLKSNIKDIIDYSVLCTWKNYRMRSLFFPDTTDMTEDEFINFFNNNHRRTNESMILECTELINSGYSLKYQLEAWMM